jgi:hypothetical protein
MGEEIWFVFPCEIQTGLEKIFTGDVMYLEVLGRPMIILDTHQSAVDLLDKRSLNYSDRPKFTFYEL